MKMHKIDINSVKNLILLLLSAVILFQGITWFNLFTNTPVPISRSSPEIMTDADFKVGISLGTLKEERWLRDRDILITKIKDLGGEAIVVNANNDDQDQINQVKYLITRGIDVLILVPNDMKKAAAAVQYAKANQVRVISYDRLVLDAPVDYYISFNNKRVGETMATHIASQLKKGNVLIVNGSRSDNNTAAMKEGYEQVLNDSELTIVGEYWADQWLSEFAYGTTDRLLSKNIRVDAILAGNDALAGAAIRALTERQEAGRVIVVGQDADLEACQRIVRGTQSATIYKPIEKLATAAAELAKALAENKRTSSAFTLENGRYTVPYIFLEPILVNKDNIESTIIEDGFHLSNDVYN